MDTPPTTLPSRRIAALVPNLPGRAPGQRVRIEFWDARLRELGWVVDVYAFEDARLREVLYTHGNAQAKASRLLGCYWRQFWRILAMPPADVVLVYREAALLGPALLERLAVRGGVPMVFDLDEPIFMAYRSPTSGWASLLKFPRKTHSLFRLADEIIAINSLIGDYAARYNPAVTVIPNFVDMTRYGNPEPPPDDPVRLVWTGSHTTMANLETITPALRRLQAEHAAPLRVVGAGSVDLPGVLTEVRQWSAETEVRDLQDCHVGLVPLTDLPWNPWKFYLKTVQYMAAGLPVVARRMGSNTEMIVDGENGFLVETQDEWHERLAMLVEDPILRRRMGAAASRTAVERYSVEAQMGRVAAVFDRAASRRTPPRRSGLGRVPGFRTGRARVSDLTSG